MSRMPWAMFWRHFMAHMDLQRRSAWASPCLHHPALTGSLSGRSDGQARSGLAAKPAGLEWVASRMFTNRDKHGTPA